MDRQGKILFFGTYISEVSGSLGPSETIANSLSDQFDVKLISKKTKAFLRLLDSIFSALTREGDVAILDVYSTKVLFQTFLISIILKIRRIPVVSVLHGGAIPETWEKKVLLYRNILFNSEKILTPSRRIQEFVTKKGFNIQYQPNPIDLKRFTLKDDSNFKRLNLLWVRAFSEIYNPDLAIKTLAILKTDFPNLRLTMIGPDKGILHQSKELVKELDLEDSVDFIGPVANEKLVSYYQSHAVYLNTTSYESFGTAVVEAAATALPIVSTRVGELPYLWEHNVNIKFASEIRAQSFATEVEYLLLNPSKAVLIGHAGANRVKEFEWNSINKNWINLISNFFRWA